MAAPRSTARDLALIAMFAGITAALGLIPAVYVPLSPVPITAQSLACMLTGAILGGRRGGLAMLLFLALVALGLPLLAGGRGGVGVFWGPTVGFLVGYVVVTWLIGVLTYRAGAPYRLGVGLLINAGCGLIVMYAFGIAGMLVRTGLSPAAALVANLPYLPGDAVKAVLAAVVAKGVHAAYPGLLPARRPVAA